MLSHVLFHAVKVAKEANVSELINLIVTDCLIAKLSLDLFEVIK